MPKDKMGNPRSGRGRMKYADEAHKDEEKEEKKEEKAFNGGGSVKGTPAKGADKKMADSEDAAAKRNDGGEGSNDDDGDIADVTEMHGPANHMEMDMDHAAGKHTVTSMHGEKRHKKTYTDPTLAIRHAHVAAGMGEPQMPQQEQNPAGGGNVSTEEMMRGMNMGGGGL